VRWVDHAVLEVGEALSEGVPVPRLEALRRRIRSELKATIGGSLQTSRIGPATLSVRSGLVQDAKPPERWQEEMPAGVQRVEDVKAGRRLGGTAKIAADLQLNVEAASGIEPLYRALQALA
jgi:hypothetical protein